MQVTYGVPSIVPIVIKGYADEPVGLKIVDLDGNVVCQGVSHPGDDYRIYETCLLTDEGKYMIKFVDVETGNEETVDSFWLDVAAPPVPEAPTWVLMAFGLLTLLGYREYSKRKKKK